MYNISSRDIITLLYHTTHMYMYYKYMYAILSRYIQGILGVSLS